MWARAERLPSAMTFRPVGSEPVRLLVPIRDPVSALRWQPRGGEATGGWWSEDSAAKV